MSLTSVYWQVVIAWWDKTSIYMYLNMYIVWISHTLRVYQCYTVFSLITYDLKIQKSNKVYYKVNCGVVRCNSRTPV